jgi:tetratricopeptide (TPR) repeat protein
MRLRAPASNLHVATSRLARARRIRLCAALLVALAGAPAAAQKIPAPPEAQEGLRLLYSGDPDAAIVEFRKIQAREADDPLGYLLEANALWWQFYCQACEIKWNTIDAWKRGKLPADERYFALCDKGIALAEAALARQETARMHFYAGMGHGLRARLHGLRMESRVTARHGVRGREHLLRAVELDPELADAYTGLGLYNYFVESLSFFVKMLRWFMGIPGGSKAEGVRQLERGMREGQFTAVEARIYLAKNLRNYDQQYARGVELLRPLAEQFPHNGVLHLLLGDLYAKLGRREPAAASFHAAKNARAANGGCAARLRAVAQQALNNLKSPRRADE